MVVYKDTHNITYADEWFAQHAMNVISFFRISTVETDPCLFNEVNEPVVVIENASMIA